MVAATPPTQAQDATWDRKYVAWNFLSFRWLGTVEYRQGLSSSTPKDAVRWILLALSALEVFLRVDFQVLGPMLPSRRSTDRLKALRPFIVQISLSRVELYLDISEALDWVCLLLRPILNRQCMVMAQFGFALTFLDRLQDYSSKWRFCAPPTLSILFSTYTALRAVEALSASFQPPGS